MGPSAPAAAGWGLCPIHLVFVCTADRTRTVPWTLKIVYYSLLETKSTLSKIFAIYQNWEYYGLQNTNLNVFERSMVKFRLKPCFLPGNVNIPCNIPFFYSKEHIYFYSFFSTHKIMTLSFHPNNHHMLKSRQTLFIFFSIVELLDWWEPKRLKYISRFHVLFCWIPLIIQESRKN